VFTERQGGSVGSNQFLHGRVLAGFGMQHRQPLFGHWARLFHSQRVGVGPPQERTRDRGGGKGTFRFFLTPLHAGRGWRGGGGGGGDTVSGGTARRGAGGRSSFFPLSGCVTGTGDKKCGGGGSQVEWGGGRSDCFSKVSKGGLRGGGAPGPAPPLHARAAESGHDGNFFFSLVYGRGGHLRGGGNGAAGRDDGDIEREKS